MTIQEIKTMLCETGLSVAYSHFNRSVSPPFIAFTVDTDTLTADGRIVRKVHSVTAELYCKSFNSKEQKLLEEIFNKHRIVWESHNIFLDSEGLFQITYEFETEETP